MVRCYPLPPGECLKVLLSKMAAGRQRTLVYADVSRAYFYAPASRAVYVDLPEEDPEPGDEDMCGRFDVSMYGTRDAALNCAEEYSETLKKAGFRRGVANTCVFWHPQKDTSVMVHGDDCVAVGESERLDSITKPLSDKYKIKVERLGTGDGDVSEVKFLNEIVGITEKGV